MVPVTVVALVTTPKTSANGLVPSLKRSAPASAVRRIVTAPPTGAKPVPVTVNGVGIAAGTLGTEMEPIVGALTVKLTAPDPDTETPLSRTTSTVTVTAPAPHRTIGGTVVDSDVSLVTAPCAVAVSDAPPPNGVSPPCARKTTVKVVPLTDWKPVPVMVIGVGAHPLSTAGVIALIEIVPEPPLPPEPPPSPPLPPPEPPHATRTSADTAASAAATSRSTGRITIPPSDACRGRDSSVRGVGDQAGSARARGCDELDATGTGRSASGW